MTSDKGRTEGFSLLELIVVMAMFAVVALIGVQVISQVLRTDRQLAGISAETEELAYGLSLLREDLSAAIALPFYPPNDLPRPAFDAPARQNQFALSLGGQATFNGTGPGRARVIWRLDPVSGRVTRQVWPGLIPGDRRLASPEVTMFNNVSAFSIEGHDADSGWSTGFPKPDAAPDTLPAAIRVTLEHQRFESIETVVTLR